MKGEENLLSVEQRTAVNSPRLCATAGSRVMYVKCKDAFAADARARGHERSFNMYIYFDLLCIREIVGEHL